MTSSQLFTPLPWQTSYTGKARRFGIEIEFSGLELHKVQQLVAKQLSLRAESAGRYRYRLVGDSAGDWLVELDFQLLTQMGEQRFNSDSFADTLQASLESLVAAVAKKVVPLELVSPPLPYQRLPEIAQLIRLLHDAGAKGSSESLHYAFGLQLNPEIPTTDVTGLLRIIQAFTCLHDWLKQQENIDFARSLSAFIAPYPLAYQLKVTNEHYQPTLAHLIDDYLKFNPSRNRALDCLPLFLHLDQQRVRAVTEDKLIKARPTFHYRLPSCEIHQEQWGLKRAWEGWVQVESLAANPERLQQCMLAYQQHLSTAASSKDNWVTEVERQWLNR